MAKLMSMGEAAERLGIQRPNAAQWLRRHLLRREQDTGRLFLVRAGRRYLVTAAALRRHAPELVDPADEISRGLREFVRDRRRHDLAVLERLDDLDAAISVLTENVRQIRGRAAVRR